MRERACYVRDRQTRQASPDARSELVQDDDSRPPVSQVELTAFVLSCLRGHHAMSCYIRGENHLLLPLSLTGDQLTATPLNFSYEGDALRKTVELSSIREPSVYELKPRELDVALVRVAMKHSFRLSMRYLDESGREMDEELIPLREENEFIVCEEDGQNRSVRILIQWIQGAQIPFITSDVSESRLHDFAGGLLSRSEPELRLSGVLLAENLRDEEHLATLCRLVEDPDSGVREAIADGTRRQTNRIRKTVMRKSYTFLDPNQDPRVFELLEKLARDESPTVRQKAAYALGDHPGTKTDAILDRLLVDAVEEVRNAADHAKGRLTEQVATASAYEAALREKGSQGARRKRPLFP